MRKKLLQQQIIQQLTSRYRKYYMNTTRNVRQIELFDVNGKINSMFRDIHAFILHRTQQSKGTNPKI